MDARRAVGQHLRHEDEHAVATARERVGDAKVALGERGAPWWDKPTTQGRRLRLTAAHCGSLRLTAAIRSLSRHRAPKTMCPSDAARIVGGAAWRSHMTEARDVAAELAHRGELDVLQRNERIDPQS